MRIAGQTGLIEAGHIVLPSAEPNLIFELADLLAACPEDHRPQLHARILTVDTGLVHKDLERLLAHLSARPVLAKGIHLYVEMPAMQRFLLSRYGAKSMLFPYLLNEPPQASSVERRELTKPVVFSYLGSARNEKGFGRLPSILRAVAAHPSFNAQRLKFVIQAGAPDVQARKLAGKFRHETAALGIGIEFHEGVASAAEYAALLERCDCLLLPYSSERYRLSGSGILFEALLHAKPFICSAGLSFSDYARDGNAIQAEDDAAFAAAILQVAMDPERFANAAQQSAKTYRASLRSNALVQNLRSA